MKHYTPYNFAVSYVVELIRAGLLDKSEEIIDALDLDTNVIHEIIEIKYGMDWKYDWQA